MRVGIIGFGGAAERIHLPACRSVDGLEVVAACDPDEQRRDRASSAGSIRRVFSTPEELLTEASPDLVIVASPPDSHGDLSVLALEHGSHVLCEKPFAPSLSEADRIIDEADQRGLMVRVNTQYHKMRIYGETERLLRVGEFGRLRFLQCWQQMYHPPGFETNWRAELRRSTLLEFGTHALDLISRFYGSPPSAISATISDGGRGTGVDLLVAATLRFDDGRVATIAFNRVSHAPERYLEMRLDCDDASLRLSLGGVARAAVDWSRQRKRPVFRANFVRGGVARVERHGVSRVFAREPRPAFAGATAAVLGGMVAEANAGESSNDAARFSRQILATALAGYASAESGEWVDVPPPAPG